MMVFYIVISSCMCLAPIFDKVFFLLFVSKFPIALLNGGYFLAEQVVDAVAEYFSTRVHVILSLPSRKISKLDE